MAGSNLTTRMGKGGRPRKPANAHLPAGVYAKKRGTGVRYYDRFGVALGRDLVAAMESALNDGREPPFSIVHFGRYTVLDEKTIVQRSRPVQALCGVYFLIHRSRVVYVGQSVNILARIADHARSVRTFDRAHWVLCPEKDLNELEATYIDVLRPPLNLAKPSRKRTHMVREPRKVVVAVVDRPQPQLRLPAR
ncbi:MAG: hypothetical protein BroJett024_41660 [Alphaproteobacteria bacterium]|nr:MAG: hypothetical protein BroJett024_41660 [Alphaproteobacteria bacterium]